MYAKDLVVIPRSWDAGSRKRRTPAYTLHRTTCRHAQRSKETMPAPVVPFEGTIACRYCKPLENVDDASG